MKERGLGGYAEICGLEERVGCVEGWEGSLGWDCSLQTLTGFLGSDWHHSPFLYCDLWYGLLAQKMSAQKQNDIFESKSSVQKVKWDVNESTSTDWF